MKGKTQFKSFSYRLHSRSFKTDCWQVKVCFTYKNATVRLMLPIKKVNKQNEKYYIDQAKKRIQSMIKDGSLEKIAEEYIKKNKKKILFMFIALFSVCALVGSGIGIYFGLFYHPTPAPPPPTPAQEYEVKVLNEGLTLTNNKAYSDRNFEADIEIDRSIITDKVMPEQLGESDVLCLDEPITYTYTMDESRYSSHILIPQENIKGAITINVPLFKPDNFPIVLDANAGEFEHGLSTLALNVLTGDKLINVQGYERPTNFREGYHFTHWELLPDRKEEDDLYEDSLVPYVEDAVYVANCERNEIAVTIDPDGGTFPDKAPGEILKLNTLYDTVINDIDGYTGEPTKAGYKFLYYAVDGAIDSKQYLPTDTVTIPGLTLNLKAVYSNSLKITLDVNGGTFPEGAETEFDTFSGITLSELVGYKEPTLTSKIFTHWTINASTYYQDTKLNITGEYTLVAQYQKCTEHDFESYTIINDKLYGICSKCGARVLIKDATLATYSNQFLLYKDGAYSFKGINEMASIISNASTNEVIEMYLINGEYDLEGSRPEDSQVIVNVHGLKNNEGELNAAVDCSDYDKSEESPYPRFFTSVNFVFDNMIMESDKVIFDFYLGLFASSIIYNHCYFTGCQSLWSPTIIFNDCVFDSRREESGAEYAFYGYNSTNVEFNRCEFLSNGKAMKIYSEGAGAGAVYKFNDCEFHRENKKSYTDKKAAIEVASEFQAGHPYKIYISRCIASIPDEFTSLYYDKFSNSRFIITE